MLRSLALLAVWLVSWGCLAQTPAATPPAGGTYRADWVTRAVDAPGVTFHQFHSPQAGGMVSYHLYTPPQAQADPQQRFPVVYWLHGSGGGLAGIPALARQFDQATREGRIPPLMVVFVNGLAEGMYVDWKDGSVRVERVIIDDLIPHIDRTHRTISTREGRMIEGFSMGGYGAARLGFAYADLFRAVSILGAGPMQPRLIQTPRAGRRRAQEILDRVYGGDQAHFESVSPRRLAELHAARLANDSLIRVVIGERDETLPANQSFHDHLSRLGIPHEWHVLPGVDHDPVRTLDGLGDARWAFYRAALASPDPAPEFELRFDVSGTSRRAIVVNAPPAGERRPVVIALHGGMGSADLMRQVTGFDDLARRERFTVVYGEGTAYREGRHAWNTGHLLRRQVRETNDIAYLDALIDRLIADHGADPSRVYLTGASNGGMMTLVYATHRSDRLAAIAPIVAAMFTLDRDPPSPLPVLFINGAKDAEVPIEGGMSGNPLVRSAQSSPYQPLSASVSFWVRVNRSEPVPQTSTSGSMTTTTHAAAEGGAVTQVIVDAEGGHGWPGRPSPRRGNQTITGFDGAERVWAFFKDKTRPQAPAHQPQPQAKP